MGLCYNGEVEISIPTKPSENCNEKKIKVFVWSPKNNFSSWTIERSFKLIAIYLGFHVTLEKYRNKLQRLFAKLTCFLEKWIISELSKHDNFLGSEMGQLY